MLLFLLSRQMRGRADEVPSFGKFVLGLELFGIVVLSMGVAYGYAEHASLNDTVWLVWQTITTVGYGDIPPKTAIGRSGVMFCGIFAILLLSYVVGAALDYREDRRRRRSLGLEKCQEKNSYLLVCCREQEELLTFITQLRCTKPGAPVCVVDDILESLPAKVAHLPHVEFVRGPILARATYERAGIANCRQVIVFPHQAEHDASDATTQTLVSLIERLVPADVPIMHFLVSQENEDLFDGLRSKAVYSDLAIYAAIQECQDQGAVEIFTSLLNNTHGANPNTFYPQQVAGWTWGEFVETAMRVSREQSILVNPLALIQGGRSNPCPDPNAVIGTGDSLSLIVHPGFSYAAFELAMTRARSAAGNGANRVPGITQSSAV